MTYIAPEIALATRDDIVGILDLQEHNLLGRGGLLSVRLPGAFIEAALDDLPQIVAHRDGKIVAYLLAGSRGVHAQTPIIQAMFRAYPGSHDAYVYGPICVAESERGHGLATALFAELRERLPGRECVAFVRRDNAASLQAHLKMGMRDVASFEHDGIAHAVLAFAVPPRT
jgi:GNAT superfamily N-acetyltransferase